MSGRYTISDEAPEPILSEFWEAFRRSRQAMSLLDGHRRYVDVNGAYVQLHGYRREDLIGRPVYAFEAEGPLMTTQRWSEAVRRGGMHGHTDFYRPDGERITVEFAGHPIRLLGRPVVLF